MTADDVPAADETAWAALHQQIPPEFAQTADESLRAERGRFRIAHLQRTDPDGAWVAEDDGEIVGVALALVREGVWGLSLFGVRPGLQGRGTGHRLLDATCATPRAVAARSSSPRRTRARCAATHSRASSFARA